MYGTFKTLDLHLVIFHFLICHYSHSEVQSSLAAAGTQEPNLTGFECKTAPVCHSSEASGTVKGVACGP